MALGIQPLPAARRCAASARPASDVPIQPGRWPGSGGAMLQGGRRAGQGESWPGHQSVADGWRAWEGRAREATMGFMLSTLRRIAAKIVRIRFDRRRDCHSRATAMARSFPRRSMGETSMCDPEPTRSTGRLRLVFASVALLLSACAPAPVRVLNGVALVPGQTAALGTSLKFELSGAGGCVVDVDWGDGQMDTSRSVDLSGTVADRTIQHNFTGWRGGKTVTVTAVRGCEGKVNTRFVTDPPVLRI